MFYGFFLFESDFRVLIEVLPKNRVIASFFWNLSARKQRSDRLSANFRVVFLLTSPDMGHVSAHWHSNFNFNKTESVFRVFLEANSAEFSSLFVACANLNLLIGNSLFKVAVWCNLGNFSYFDLATKLSQPKRNTTLKILLKKAFIQHSKGTASKCLTLPTTIKLKPHRIVSIPC